MHIITICSRLKQKGWLVGLGWFWGDGGASGEGKGWGGGGVRGNESWKRSSKVSGWRYFGG